jgi:hypothetical protein
LSVFDCGEKIDASSIPLGAVSSPTIDNPSEFLRLRHAVAAPTLIGQTSEVRRKHLQRQN